MPKGERISAGDRAKQQYGDIGANYTALTGQLQNNLLGLQGTEAANQGASFSAASNLASTGGISASDQQTMERNASHATQSAYSSAAADAKRKQAITGGFGGAGEELAIARQGGQAAKQAITGVDTNIAGLRQSGMIAGTQALTQQYGISADQATKVQQLINQATQQGYQLQQGDIDALVKLSQESSVLGSVVGGIAQLGGAAGSILTGINTGKP